MESYHVELVRNKLLYELFWHQVSEYCSYHSDGHEIIVLKARTHEDSPEEYILPYVRSQSSKPFLTLEYLDELFESHLPTDVKKCIIAIISDDGTTVFYNMYKGIGKPRKN